MNLEISDDQTVGQVQGQFHQAYPFLKIDFFEKDLQVYARERQAKPVLDINRFMREFRSKTQLASSISVNNEMKVKEIENAIDLVYGLKAQVFRRSGNVWLETTVTNNWSLEEQNRQGEIITMQLHDK